MNPFKFLRDLAYRRALYAAAAKLRASSQSPTSDTSRDCPVCGGSRLIYDAQGGADSCGNCMTGGTR